IVYGGAERKWKPRRGVRALRKDFRKEGSNMEGTFKGKRALITGGGGGIGKEIVLLLKRKGANVVIIDRSKNDLEALKKEIECDTILADLSDAEQAKKAAERALPVDLLVNCAGVN